MNPKPTDTTPPAPLSNRQIRDLKARAQRLNAVTKLGRAGLSADFIAGVDRELGHHELIKVKLTEFKDLRFDLAQQIAAQTRSHVIGVIGHVIILFRPKPVPETSPVPPAPAPVPQRPSHSQR